LFKRFKQLFFRYSFSSDYTIRETMGRKNVVIIWFLLEKPNLNKCKKKQEYVKDIFILFLIMWVDLTHQVIHPMVRMIFLEYLTNCNLRISCFFSRYIRCVEDLPYQCEYTRRNAFANSMILICKVRLRIHTCTTSLSLSFSLSCFFFRLLTLVFSFHSLFEMTSSSLWCWL